MSHSKTGLDKLFQSDLLKVMKDVMATSDIVRYRIYEVRSTVCHFGLFTGAQYATCFSSIHSLNECYLDALIGKVDVRTRKCYV